VAIAIDDAGALLESAGSEFLRRVLHLGADTGARITLLLASEENAAGEEIPAQPVDLRTWALVIRLTPLTRAEVEQYLVGKLEAAGCRDRIFTPRAITRLHHRSGGMPRGIDRLASLCLRAGASRGLESVSAALVESVLSECHLPPGEQLVSDVVGSAERAVH
jgi:type II secretory pathway predicted ATPase ExeA